MVPYYLLLFAYQMTLVLTSITRLGPRFWEDIEPKTTKYLGPNGTTMDPEYLDYLLSITQLPAYKLYSANEHWKWTSHHWVVDENFTTDLNMLVNPNQKKNQSRAVVDYAIIDDMKDKNAYCRCWRSKKFPLCDGAHLHHNNRTGDNVGPLLIKDEDALTNSTEFFHYMCNLRKRK